MAALFTQVQAGPAVSGTGSVALTCAATQPGTMLAADLVASTTTALTPPSANWRLGNTVAAGSAGHLEQWYLEPGNNPGGIRSVTFTGPAGTLLEGGLSEHSLPAGYKAILESAGQNSGSGGSMPLASACGNAADCLGLAAYAVFFSASQSGTWTSPATWTFVHGTATGTMPWRTVAAEDLTLGNQVLSGAAYSVTAGSWCASLVTFRAIKFDIMGIDGGEMAESLCTDPTGQVIIVAGDVECMWRSVDGGDHWHTIADGIYSSTWKDTACVEWSQMTSESGYPNTVYACVGSSGNDGGLLVSQNGGTSWSMRNTTIGFKGNHSGSPPLPSNVPADGDRWAGRLLAQDPGRGLLYACTANMGVARGSGTPPGSSWTAVQGSGATALPTAYARCIVLNPANKKEAWAGLWDTGAYPPTSSSLGGVWHTADATAASPAWNQLGGWKGTVADLVIVGSYLYAACNTGGVYRAPLSGGALVSLNDNSIVNPGPGDAGSGTAGIQWNAIDGFVNNAGNHVLYVGQGLSVQPSATSNKASGYRNIVKGTGPAGGTISWIDATNQASGSVTYKTMPPDGRTFWLAPNTSYPVWIGGRVFRNPHLRINPANNQQIYVTAAGGFARSADAGLHWAEALNGMAMFDVFDFAIDPADNSHVVLSTGDHTSVDLAGDPTGMTGVTTQNPGPNGSETHACCFGPEATNPTLFVGINKKFGGAGGGAAYARAANSPNGPWTEIGFTALAGGAACTGLYSGTDGTGAKYLLAVGQGTAAGMFKGTYTGTGSNVTVTWQAQTATQAAVAQGGESGQHIPIISDGHGYLYMFDRKQGVYRSSDFGTTWTQISNKTIASPQNVGWIAVNPNNTGQLWLSVDAGTNTLFRLGGIRGAVGSITTTAITTGPSADCGGIAFYNGTLYAVWMNDSTHTSAQLMATTDLASSAPAWTDAGGDSFGSYGQSPHKLDISPAGLAICGTGYNVCLVGSLAPVALSVQTTSLPAGTVGTAYPSGTALAALGGSPPYTWALASGSLPPGLPIGTDGTISGTPSAATGSPFSFTATVRDTAGHTATSGTLTISVTTAPALTITTSSMPGGTVGTAYPSTQLDAQNGTAPYTWKLTSGTLPPGLSGLTSSFGAGLITGTPTTATGSPFSFGVQVQDSASPAATAAATLSITVQPAGAALAVTSSGAQTAGSAGTPYNISLGVQGGVAPYTWNTTPATGSLPAGLAIGAADGSISGTPTTAGTSTFTVTVQDSAGGSATSASLSITITASAPDITTLSLPNGAVGTAYGPGGAGAQVTASGGTTPYTWTLATGSGPLPPGLALSASGTPSATISGTPTTTGTYSFSVQVTDAGSLTDIQPLAITIPAVSLAITTASLPAATIGAAYSVTLHAQGGRGSYTWAAIDPLLGLPVQMPPGFTFNTSTGVLSGTGTVTGSTSILFQVTDATGNTALQELAVVVLPAPGTAGAEVLTLAADGTWQLPAPETLAGGTWQPDGVWTISGGTWA